VSSLLVDVLLPVWAYETIAQKEVRATLSIIEQI